MFSLVLALATSVTCLTNANWYQVNGKLKQIQVGDQFGGVCGVTSDDDIYCARTENYEWYQLPGKLMHVTVANSQIYGVNANNEIYYSKSFLNGTASWVRLPGSLKQIHFDGHVVCGTNSGDEIYCADQNVDSNPNWTLLPGSLKQVVVHGGKLFGVNTRNEIYASPSYRNPVWTRVPGILQQIQYDGQNLCGVNDVNDIYCALQRVPELLATDPQWDRVDGKLEVVSTGGYGRLIGVTSKGDIFAGALPHAFGREVIVEF